MSEQLRNHLRQFYRICPDFGHLLIARTGKRFRQKLFKPFNRQSYNEACLIYCLHTGHLPELVQFKNGNRADLHISNLVPINPKAIPTTKTGIPYVYQSGIDFWVRPPRETASIYKGLNLEEALCHLIAWWESCPSPTQRLEYAALKAKHILKLKPVFKKRPEPPVCLYCGHRIFLAEGRRLPRHCPVCSQRWWWVPPDKPYEPKYLDQTFIYQPETGFIFPVDVVGPAPDYNILNPETYPFWTQASGKIRPFRDFLELPSRLRHKNIPRSVFVWAFHNKAWPPPGKNIRFRDGDPTNTRIENLYIGGSQSEEVY